MTEIDRLRQRNIERAEQEGQDPPFGQGPGHVPIGEAIQDFHARGAYAFGIPAHRSGRGAIEQDAVAWTGADAFRADVGMNNGVDNRHQSWQVEPTAMELFAQAVGADQTLFSTNGSTLNVHVALLTALKPGETVVMARNMHKSAFAGLVLSGARPVYVDPVYDEDWDLAHGVDPLELARVLTAHPEARAVMIGTPTYYGVSPDVRGLVDVAHAHGIPILCDDAWGLDYCFCSRLPESAIAAGADLAIGSVHKTLSGFGQTSVLSIQGDLIDAERLSLVFELEQSTSASSLLLSSIDAARRQFQRDGEWLLGDALDRAHRARAAIDAIDGLDLMGEDVLGRPGAVALDPTHLTFDVTGLGLTGYEAADWLRRNHRVEMELTDHRRVMALITYADGDEQVDRLIGALEALAAADHRRDDPGDPDWDEVPAVPPTRELREETVMLPRDAVLGATEVVPWREAVGRISAELVCPYPPGIPITAPGERLSQAAVDYLQSVAALGGMVEGAVDESLARLRVVAE